MKKTPKPAVLIVHNVDLMTGVDEHRVSTLVEGRYVAAAGPFPTDGQARMAARSIASRRPLPALSARCRGLMHGACSGMVVVWGSGSGLCRCRCHGDA